MIESKKRPGCVIAYAIFLFLSAGLCTLWGFSGVVDSLGYDNSLGPILTLAFLTGAALNVVMAIGIWQLKNWARILVLISSGLGVASSVLTLFTFFLSPAGSSSVYLPSAYYTGKAMSLIVGFIGLVINSTIFDWFKKNGKYFNQHTAVASTPKPAADGTTPAQIPVPAAQPSGFRLATSGQQEDNIGKIKRWCDQHKDERIKVNVVSIYEGREDTFTSAHGKLLAIEEHPAKKGVYRMRFDSHTRGPDEDAVMLGYEISGVEARNGQLTIYKSTQQRFELFAAGTAPSISLPAEPPMQIPVPVTANPPRPFGFWNYAVIVLVIVGLMAGIAIILWLTAPSQPTVAISAPTITHRPANTPNYAATQKAQSTRAAATAEFAWVKRFAQPILNDVHNRKPNFADDFSVMSGRFVRWGEEQGVSFTGDVMRINTGDRDWVGAGGSMLARDFVLEFDFTPRIVGDESGVFVNFRAGDPGGYNFGFNLHDIWWGMGSLPAGEDYHTVVDGWSVQVALNRKTTVIIIAKGDRFAFYANGKPLLYVVNTEYTGKWVDLGVYSPDSPSEVDFDNVEFWDLNNLQP